MRNASFAHWSRLDSAAVRAILRKHQQQRNQRQRRKKRGELLSPCYVPLGVDGVVEDETEDDGVEEVKEEEQKKKKKNQHGNQPCF